MKKIIILSIISLAILVATLSFRTPFSATSPAAGYTGAPPNNRTCVNCHNDFALNSGGGSVFATGLPSGTYNAGQVYNFSITITHGSPAGIWGFEIKACQTDGTVVGTFSTTNPNVVVASSELKQSNAVIVTGTSYTYTNLKWTAPSTGTSTVNFYMTGLAGDNDGSSNGDYVYSNTIMSVIIPLTMGEFTGNLCNNAVQLQWQTYSESGFRHFEVERSTDGTNFNPVQTISGTGNSNTVHTYSYTDTRLPASGELLYYRLKIIDWNGSYEYSKVIRVKTSGFVTSIMNVYPTVIHRGEPVQVEMNSSSSQPVNIAVYGMNGEKIGQQVQMLAKGRNSFSIRNIVPLSSGILLVRITTAGFAETRKILVQ
jgi:hypothetical protein